MVATLSCVAQHIDNRYSIPTTGMNYERSLGFLERHPYDAAVKANTTAPRHLEYRGIKFTNDTITSHKSHKKCDESAARQQQQATWRNDQQLRTGNSDQKFFMIPTRDLREKQ